MFNEKRMNRKDGENMFSLGIRKLVVISLAGGIFLLGNIWLVYRTSEFDARITPKQTGVLDRAVSPLSTKVMDNDTRISGAAGGHWFKSSTAH
ncbi:MAG: hypothetical protein ISS69_09455 [Phycisphaerae bacterium]|nr:hypothetical protein [Phycisphaerae bacterium]